MANTHIDYSKFISIEKDVLTTRLKSIRAVLQHNGEKGRALKHEVPERQSSFLLSAPVIYSIVIKLSFK